jgi:transcriptional regulator with XRE-family HTH domain
MAQSQALVDALKRALKARGRTYADVAAALGLSTASVKRLFASQTLSLKRIDAICALVGLEFTDLLREVESERRPLRHLSEVQEQAIAGDLPLLLVTVAVLNGLGLADMLARFRLTQHQCVRKLAWLDREGLIDLLPKNRVLLKVAPNFSWRPDGPIQRFFQTRLAGEYFSARFAAEGERLVVLNGLLSEPTRARFQRRLERLAQEFDELNREDAALPIAEKRGYTVVLAQRPWVFGLFAELLRE